MLSVIFVLPVFAVIFVINNIAADGGVGELKTTGNIDIFLHK